MQFQHSFLLKALFVAASIAVTLPASAADKKTDNRSAFDKAYDPETKTIHLDPDDPTGDMLFDKRDYSKDKRPAGPINVQRYNGGLSWQGIPTFFKLPVAITPEDLKAGKVDVAIMGVPMSAGGYGQPGTGHGAQTMRISETMLPWGVGGVISETQVDPFEELVIVDYGDAAVDPLSVERSLASIRDTVAGAARAGAVPIMIGGDHSIMYPSVLGIADVYGKKNFSILHVDAHTDISTENFGHYVTIGNMVRLSVEEGLVKGEEVHAVGQRSPGYGPAKLKWYKENGVRIYWQGEIETRGFRAVVDDLLEDLKAGPGKLYLSIDYDVLDPAAMSAVTAPVLGGWTTRQLVELIRSVCVVVECIGVDFVEYNPFFDDQGNRGGNVALSIVRETLGAIAMRKKGIREPFYYHPAILGKERKPKKK
ncbi:MAG: agmatinase [Gammaproteobacteria bacterium]|nr:agmatinase [Gammaproteobacteria bacterium]